MNQAAPHFAPYSASDALLNALPSSIKENAYTPHTNIHPISDVDQDFAIRSYSSSIPALNQSIRQKLLDSSALTAPSYLFVGPDVGQPLLVLNDKTPSACQMKNKPHFEVVRFHSGQNLEQARVNGDDLTPVIKRLVDHPEELRELYHTAAFIGMQPKAPIQPDIHGKNIMIGEDNRLQLVDMVGSEHIVRDTLRDPQDLRDRAMSYLNEYCGSEDVNATKSLHQTLQAALVGHKQRRDMYARFDENALPPLQKQLLDSMNTILAETKALVEQDALEAQHPEWKGFVKTDDVSCAVLDQPPHALKLKLQELYAKAVPEHGAAR